ncbi:hypothetical protein L2E82_05937 [Cichorium intybus]|uniref:Uncharacterized protein n=1 Tax=Cichorium intybus TaxID=13427 RepID=A0ACB9H8L6_CICIN|nr:hypothetical protein L2E82_05937 [Cichorium intybus]
MRISKSLKSRFTFTISYVLFPPLEFSYQFIGWNFLIKSLVAEYTTKWYKGGRSSSRRPCIPSIPPKPSVSITDFLGLK